MDWSPVFSSGNFNPTYCIIYNYMNICKCQNGSGEAGLPEKSGEASNSVVHIAKAWGNPARAGGPSSFSVQKTALANRTPEPTDP